MKKITLNNDQLVKLLLGMTSNDSYRKIMLKIIMNMLDDNQIDLLINYLHRDYDIKNIFKLFKIGDKVKFKPGKYDFKDINKDIMVDKGIMMHGGYMTGMIIGSPDYGSDFNPTYYRISLLVPVLDNNNKIITEEHDVNTLELEYLDDFDENLSKRIWDKEDLV